VRENCSGFAKGFHSGTAEGHCLNRVAQNVGCDPSYVSRVARGERTSELISEVLRAEVQQTWTIANVGSANGSARIRKAKAQQSTEKAVASSKKS